ncbi:transporter [Erwinia endophytica]|uniref:TolC family outer membrane protein n=1 Tax=Erwinia endophytica TaxID=1563158 RepID=UPI00126601DE|nr:TolC family outer membrane protein [Erwinia endophytica]KAB8311503.1 transporter [Erwinia endophytica]
MKKIFITLCCVISVSYACAAEKKPFSTAQSNADEAPAGFWGAFSKTPEPDQRPAGGTDLAKKLNVSPAEIEMQPTVKDPVTLEKNFPADWQSAIHLAVSRHPAISSTIASLESADFTIDAAKGGYLPAIKAGVTSGRQQDEGTGQIFTVGLSQMLYDFGKTGSAVDQASAKYLRQQASVLEQIDTIVQQTALALNEVYRYSQLVDNAKKQVKSLRDVMSLTQMRAEAGASTRVDPVQAQARVEAAEAQQQEMEIKLQQQQYHLQSLLGQPVPSMHLSAPHELLSLINKQGEKVDLNKNPTILMAQADVAIARAELRSYKAQRYPTLSLEANTNKYVGDIEKYQSHSQYQNVYLSVSSTLYQGGSLAAQESASARALEAAKSLIASKKLELTDQQRSYYQSINGLQRNISLLTNRMKTITETRSLYREQYLSLGNRNALDLLNAEQEISRAEQDLINARCDLWAASVNYIVLAGMARDVFNLNGQVIQGLRITQ